MKKLIFIVSFVFLALFFTQTFNFDHIQLYAQKNELNYNLYDSLLIAAVAYIDSNILVNESIISIDKQVVNSVNEKYTTFFISITATDDVELDILLILNPDYNIEKELRIFYCLGENDSACKLNFDKGTFDCICKRPVPDLCSNYLIEDKTANLFIDYYVKGLELISSVNKIVEKTFEE